MQRPSASSVELARLSELIDLIYQGATDESRWHTTFPAIAEWVGGERGMLHTPLTPPADGGFFFNHAMPAQGLQLWWTRYRHEDIWATRSIERGLIREGNIVDGDDEVPFEELRETAVYRNFLSQFDIAHLLSGIIFGLEGQRDTPYMVISLVRGVAAGRYTADERARLAILIPHLSRALGVMTRLRRAEHQIATSRALLEQLPTGVLLFDPHGRVAFANRAARRVLEQEDGLKLRPAGDAALGWLVADDPRSHAAMKAAVGSLIDPDLLHTSHFSQAVTIARPSGLSAYVLNFSALAAHNEFGTGSDAPRAIAFLTDAAEPIRLDGELFRKTYALTPAELRLAEVLVEGLTVEEAAARLGVSRSTVKTQLQNIYGKTGTNNRARLMKLVVSLAQCTPG